MKVFVLIGVMLVFCGFLLVLSCTKSFGCCFWWVNFFVSVLYRFDWFIEWMVLNSVIVFCVLLDCSGLIRCSVIFGWVVLSCGYLFFVFCIWFLLNIC